LTDVIESHDGRLSHVDCQRPLMLIPEERALKEAMASRMPSKTDRQIFPGDSELAGLMRGLDWSKTDLGAPKTWPEHWRTAVRLCLTSRIPVVMYWGPAFTVLYNDPYISLLGPTKHPRYLGQPGRECWSEIWDTIGPMLESVYATGKATWSEELLLFIARNLPREEVYVRFTFGPMIAADGRTVDGIFCPCTETTEQVLSARRLETLRRLGVRPGEARTVEAACRDAADVLSENPHDVPFAAIYVVDELENRASICASAGLSVNGSSLPPSVSLDRTVTTPWPFATALRTRRQATVNLVELDAGIHAGPWPEPISEAVVVPIPAAEPGMLAGFLVAGASSRRVLDPAYQTFFDLVASHIGTAIAEAQAHEAARKRAEALAELDRAKTAFFSNVSHEFRTPLTLLLGPLEDSLADTAEPLPAGQRARQEVAHRNALRLLRLVNTLLDFSRIEASRVEAVFESVDLASLTRDLASMFQSAIERAGLRLVIDCPPMRHATYLDRDMWEKIVLNLLSNALKFTFQGAITVTLRDLSSTVEVSISDTGIGIASEELPHIFERFHRIPGARGRTHEGTGIGLALVQELVRLHGGAVTVTSELNRGTTFTVSIPTGRDHLPADRVGAARTLASTGLGSTPFIEEALRWLPDQIQSETTGSAGAAVATRGARILLTDDNADMREYVRRLLSQHWTIDAVGDGQAALEAALARPPDLILADVMMPRLDGFALLHAVRAAPTLRNTPVILVSARAGEESRVEGLDAGADDYIVKPFSARELIARVNARLELARARQEALAREHTAREQAEHTNRGLTALANLSTRLVRKGELEGPLSEILDAGIQITGADLGNIQLVNADTSSLEIAVHRGFDSDFLAFFSQGSDPEGARGAAMRAGQRLIIADVAEDPLLAGTDTLGVLLSAGVRAMQSTPIRSPAGELIGILSTHYRTPRRPEAHDLHLLDMLGHVAAGYIERARVERDIAETQGRLELADRAKDEFLAMLGHELRNPLGAVAGAVAVLNLASLPPGAERARAVVERQVQHLSRLVDDLLDVSRVTTGKIGPGTTAPGPWSAGREYRQPVACGGPLRSAPAFARRRSGVDRCGPDAHRADPGQPDCQRVAIHAIRWLHRCAAWSGRPGGDPRGRGHGRRNLARHAGQDLRPLRSGSPRPGPRERWSRNWTDTREDVDHASRRYGRCAQ
jgi:signal transduction histidine kinase/DNA-binding response OmpR family regulator